MNILLLKDIFVNRLVNFYFIVFFLSFSFLQLSAKHSQMSLNILKDLIG